MCCTSVGPFVKSVYSYEQRQDGHFFFYLKKEYVTAERLWVDFFSLQKSYVVVRMTFWQILKENVFLKSVAHT